MASMVAKATSSSSPSQMSPSASVIEKGNRNKRKYRADPPMNDVSKGIPLSQNDCLGYKFTAEKFGVSNFSGPTNFCDLRGINQDNSSGLSLDLGLVRAHDASDSVPFQDREGLEVEGSHDADWSDPTESQLEELVLKNLDAIFKSAIKKIVACGYSEEIATESVLRSGLCYGCKDTVSNIVDNALAFLRTGREVDPSREHCFEDLQHLEGYVLAELVCVLREVRPFFSTGDAMWCLLLCDMNVSHACAMDGDSNHRFSVEDISNGISSTSSHSEPKTTQKTTSRSELSKPMPAAASCHISQEGSTETAVMGEDVQKSSTIPGTSHSQDGKLSRTTKRDCLLRHKSPHLEKSYRVYGSKGSKKLSSYGGLMLDKKLRSSSVSIKNASRLSKAMAVDIPSNCEPSQDQLQSSSVISAADTELSLSLPSKPNAEKFPSCYSGNLYDKKYDIMIKLLPRIQELQSQLHEWKEWANQKVMQAARRLSKEKEELDCLRKESKEVERLKKEKQIWEENTMKKLSEMENALCKASGQVERANSAARRLEVEKTALRQEMEIAKARAAESAASCQEAAKREKTTLTKFKSWEKQKIQLQEEFATEKQKAERLLQDLESAKQLHEQQEARRQQEEKEKDELLSQASSIRKKREELEVSTRAKENAIKLKAETNMLKYKDDVQRLEREISQLRLKADSFKIATLRRGIDASYASRVTDGKSETDNWTRCVSELVTHLQELSDKGVKRERECVMCLSEEMSVVFLPCAHQVVCTTCNELHEKRGMKDCPSCRGPIHRRIPVHFARS